MVNPVSTIRCIPTAYPDNYQPVRKQLEKSDDGPSELYHSRGAHLGRDGTTFRVYAPNAKQVALVLTEYGRAAHTLPMNKNEAGVWEVSTSLAPPGRTYLYSVVDCHGQTKLRTDPFSFSTMEIPEVQQTHSVVVDHEVFQWQDQAWLERRRASDRTKLPLAIYEVQLKSWKIKAGQPLNYCLLAPELIVYCKKMGFTHLELYGILDHLDPKSRGYQVSNFFAPFNGLGSCDDLKYFINECHKAGLAVILDWIPTHFHNLHRSDQHSTSLHEFDGSNLFAAENTNWGSVYSDCSKPEMHRLLVASVLYWVAVMHFDGIRGDAISQLVRRNGRNIDSGIAFAQEVNETIERRFPGVLKIAEESEGFPNVTKKVDQGGLGFDLEWGMGWSHDSRNYLRTPYSERAKAEHHQGKILNYLRYSQIAEKYILTESHDDSDSWTHQGSLYHLASHAPDEPARFADIRNYYCWQILAPSYGHLIHMGEELGQPQSWYPRSQQGLSSVQWELLENKTSANFHRGLQKCVKDLHHVYQSRSAFWKNGQTGFKLISECAANCVVAYHRTDGENQVAVVHNFKNVGYPSYDIPLLDSVDELYFKHLQSATEIFNSDADKYGGSGQFTNREVKILRRPGTDQPAHFRVALPPLSTIVLHESSSETLAKLQMSPI